MEVKIINEELFAEMFARASRHVRHRDWFDLRNSADDGSQRMMVAVLPTDGPDRIARHENTSESFMLLKGRMDVMLYDMQSDGSFVETQRIHLCPAEGNVGIQIPKGVWHSVEVFENSVFFESKDGPYIPGK